MLSTLALFSVATLPQGQVLVVDGAGGPGADFTTIFAAVDVAADGDLVLVRSGDYDSDGPGNPNGGLDAVSIFGKSLVLVADQGADVRTNSLQVHGLSRRGWVLIQGLRFEQQGITGWLTDNQGAVWLEGCSLRSRFFVNDHEALRISNCDSVVVTRSDIAAPVVEPGIHVARSRLDLWQSVVRGGPAVQLSEALLSLSGSEVRGTDGMNGSPFFQNGGAAGDGLVLELGSQAWIQDSILAGGAGGVPFGFGLPGADGEALVLTNGVVHPLADASKSLEISSPVRVGAPITLTVRGKPGDLVWLRLALAPERDETVRGRTRAEFLGTIPAGGALVLTASVPKLPAGREGMVVFCRATVRDADSQRLVASSPSVLVLLHQSL